jgi:hypothetical protein
VRAGHDNEPRVWQAIGATPYDYRLIRDYEGKQDRRRDNCASRAQTHAHHPAVISQTGRSVRAL